MNPFTISLITLSEQPYSNYNTILPQIKEKLMNADFVGPQRVETFERVLTEELPLTTARRAYRTAICMAMGEEKGYCREFRPAEKLAQKFNRKK